MSWIPLILLSLSLFPSSIATSNSHLSRQNSYTTSDTEIVGDYACRIIGECEPCPINSLLESVCKPTGSRRKLSCLSLLAPTYSVINPPIQSSPLAGSLIPTVHNGHSSTGPIQSITNPIAPPLEDPSSSPATIESLQAQSELETEADALGLDPEPEGIDDEDFQDVMRESNERNYKRQMGMVGAGAVGGGTEIDVWEACEHVLVNERADFFEFIFSNLFIAVVALTVLIFRSRNLAERQYGRLAARIGVTFVQGGATT